MAPAKDIVDVNSVSVGNDGPLLVMDLAITTMPPLRSLLVDPTLSTKDEFPPLAAVTSARVIAINFPVFSDGRGFTIARRLRTSAGFTGTIVATGHIIPDQADYLFRCGFTVAEIKPDQQAYWQAARRFITARFQHMPGSPRSRPKPL